jgi:hypothetical protein
MLEYLYENKVYNNLEYCSSVDSVSNATIVDETCMETGLPTIVFVHALNPYGMANNRRFNEDNVDLNRNFLSLDEFHKAVTRDNNIAGYDDFWYLLNPVQMPTSRYALIHSLAYSITGLLTHSLTYSLAHLLTYLLTYSLTYSLTHSLTHLLTHSLTHLLTHLSLFLFYSSIIPSVVPTTTSPSTPSPRYEWNPYSSSSLRTSITHSIFIHIARVLLWFHQLHLQPRPHPVVITQVWVQV